ncbi:MAG: peptidoglycan DD-metalloendopeptidase family protein [Rhodospirillaceae bacterium]|nr:peptidoglycan DD-metalloendopeptidase family protein [Rhodospirillaceae bacterium]
MTYTTAGIAVMGGVGAFESHRPASISAADAAALISEFSGTQAVAAGFASLGTLSSDETLPVWAQRMPTDTQTYTVAAAEGTVSPMPLVAAPALAALSPGSALEAAIATPTNNTELIVTPSFTQLSATSGPALQQQDQLITTEHMAAQFGMETGKRDWDADDTFLQAASREIQKVIEVQPGDTLFGVLVDAGLSQEEATSAVGALADVFSPRSLKAGQEITLNLATGGTAAAADQAQLVSLSLEPSVERDVTVTRDAQGALVAEAVDKPLTETRARAAGIITYSLYDAAMKAGLPSSVIADVIKAYSYDVDFQRDIQEGDSFEIVYERFENADGELARTGQMLYAMLNTSGVAHPIYWFERDGDGEFFTPKGEAVRKNLLATPIDGARITSGFGQRKHPILGYTKMHKGMDFGAPTGTPIYAAGNGTVVEIGKKGAYGNYIRLKHNGTYQTAYAHASKFAKGLKKGDKVKQGQVIAYVGTTGRSTGPHLHFEVLEAGVQINPKKIKSTGGDKLAGKDLKTFKALVAAIDAERQLLRNVVEIAETPGAAPLDCSTDQGCEN